MNNTELRKLPSVDRILADPVIQALSAGNGRALVVYATRQTLAYYRDAIGNGAKAPEFKDVIGSCATRVASIANAGLRQVINATGVAIHTNLGRAPLGLAMLEEISGIASGYTNLEFDLIQGRRGERTSHIAPLLRFITGAEDVAVVNNNAAALLLTLKTLAEGREVIVSRGELIEIGGAFRIPDIMAQSGARMIEVGTTNRTRLSDYENALTDSTALLFKAHKSNYAITGFTEEVSIARLASLAKKHTIPMVYDIGSGLLRRPAGILLGDEPDVASALQDGADCVTFSGDKLLGGPQAGIIAGRAEIVRQCAKAPLMRALRVGKLTIAALAAACRHYLHDETLAEKNPLFTMLEQTDDVVRARADRLYKRLAGHDLAASVVESIARIGGGTLPQVQLQSYAVTITPPPGSSAQRERFAERVFDRLMQATPPVVGILREGQILLDVFAIFDQQVDEIATITAAVVKGEA